MLSVRINAEYRKGKPVLADVAFDVAPGEILGLVGQSGSGKSTIALSILRLLSMRGGVSSGSVQLRGRELSTLSERDLRQIRGKEIGFALCKAQPQLSTLRCAWALISTKRGAPTPASPPISRRYWLA